MWAVLKFTGISAGKRTFLSACTTWESKSWKHTGIMEKKLTENDRKRLKASAGTGRERKGRSMFRR